MTRDRTFRVITLGAALSANKGAASMLHALMDNFDEQIGPATFFILTTHPKGDREALEHDSATIVPTRPLSLIFPLLPIALLAWLVRTAGLSPRSVCITRPAREIADADVVLDVSGISFSDDRSFPILVYNTLMTAIPLLMGAKVVKCSQALGPFAAMPTRLAARAVLPRVDVICARGAESYEHLTSLGLRNVVKAADLAFVMKVPEGADSRAQALTRSLGERYVVVSPSAVVKRYCDTVDLDYVDIMSRFTGSLIADGRRVLLMPHSYLTSAGDSRLNDGPVCREVFSRLQASDLDGACVLLDTSESPTVLRAIIARADALITSRFHAMVSALSSSTPVMVVGWSHKYAEVMKTFGLDDYVLRFEDLDLEHLKEMFARVDTNAETLRTAIEGMLPTVKDEALENFRAVSTAIDSARRR